MTPTYLRRSSGCKNVKMFMCGALRPSCLAAIKSGVRVVLTFTRLSGTRHFMKHGHAKEMLIYKMYSLWMCRLRSAFAVSVRQHRINVNDNGILYILFFMITIFIYMYNGIVNAVM